MKLHELAIKRYVFAYMLSAVMVLFGIISYKDIGIDRYPTIELPMISVTTILPGATPEIIDSSVTNLIESVVNSTPGIDHIQSNSSAGVSIRSRLFVRSTCKIFPAKPNIFYSPYRLVFSYQSVLCQIGRVLVF